MGQIVEARMNKLVNFNGYNSFNFPSGVVERLELSAPRKSFYTSYADRKWREAKPKIAVKVRLKKS